VVLGPRVGCSVLDAVVQSLILGMPPKVVLPQQGRNALLLMANTRAAHGSSAGLEPGA
jgi:hypothetical protein